MRVVRLLLVVLGVGALGGVLLPLLVAGEAPVASGTADSAPLSLGALATPSTSPGERRAVQLLRRAATAGQTRAYTGTQYVTSWSEAGTASVIVEVQHVPDRGMVVRVEGGPTAPPRAGRHEAAMVTDPPAAGIDARALSALERHYVLRVVGTGHCAGRVTDIVDARRVSGGELTARFWLDRDSGLLLRRELYDASGRTVRAAAFVDLSLGAPVHAAAAEHEAREASDGAKLTLADLRRLRRAGWAVPPALPGGLDLYDARMANDGGERHRGSGTPPAARGSGSGRDERVLHLSYSDGLFTISVFAQRGRLNTSRFSGWTSTQIDGATVYTQPGLSERAVWSGRNRVYTVVADAPDVEVAHAVATFPHKVASDGFVNRVDRGLSKMAAWFD